MTFFPDFGNIIRDSKIARWFIFARQDTGYAVLAGMNEQGPGIPVAGAVSVQDLELDNRFYIGKLEGISCYTGTAEHNTIFPKGLQFAEARSLYGVIDGGEEAALSRARGIVHWDATNRFCGRCGTELATDGAEPMKRCPSCGLTIYPVISPAVIVLIRNGNAILLANNKRFPKNLYSCVAGFVETGETLEEAVHREVEEETGIQIQNLRYFGSQPWPFPNSLMIAFVADYAGGNIKLEDDDIRDVKWFAPDALPDLPLKGSISRWMIDRFLENDPEEL